MNDLADTAAMQLAEGFARHVEGWARRLPGADAATVAAVRGAAQALSLATSGGHVCLALDELAAQTAPLSQAAPLRQALLASGLVGTPAAPGALPLILDEGDRLYLHRYFDYERRLAQRLVRAASAAPMPVDAATAGFLNQLFAANAAALGGRPDWQKIAAAMALRGRITVISGGPGTGKTTTVVHLLACLIAQQPGCRIALAAPTGKAAARMTDALRQRAAHLPAAVREQLPRESYTVHRLLGVRPGRGGFIHHAGHPLAIDLLVVDEASMLDLSLATQLLEAVPDGARIVLLGDKDQLAAVEAGAVFAELSADPSMSDTGRQALAALCGLPPDELTAPVAARAGALPDTAVWFTQNFRFDADSGIGRLAADINSGRAMAAVAWLRGGGGGGGGGDGGGRASIQWIDDAGPAPGAAARQRLLDGFGRYLDAVQALPADADATARAAVFAAFERWRVLCAVREGPRGVAAVNELVSQHARDRLGGPGADPRDPWYAGRPVMVLRNDPLLKLFNGDIGIVLPGPDGALKVWFADAGAGQRAIAPARLPVHQTAYAMTVHKSQGSEFDQVFVLLPTQRSRVLTRELLYTAVTRARSQVVLCAGADVLAGAIQASTTRHSGLQARIHEALAAQAVEMKP